MQFIASTGCRVGNEAYENAEGCDLNQRIRNEKKEIKGGGIRGKF